MKYTLLLLQITLFGLSSKLFAQISVENKSIIEKAYAAAGGETYRRPKSYHLMGQLLDFTRGTEPTVHRPYDMWRVHPEKKEAGHKADGLIRVSGYMNGKATMQFAFDGKESYDIKGPTGQGADADFWKNTMGFGMIRFALDEGYEVRRLADDMVDGKTTYTFEIKDPSKASSTFSIRKDDYRIVKVAFVTPKGLHERIFSDFYTKPGVSWVQPRRLRSVVNGVKQFEFIYEDFEINKEFPEDLFKIKTGEFTSETKPQAPQNEAKTEVKIIDKSPETMIAEISRWWAGGYNNHKQVQLNTSIEAPIAPEITQTKRVFNAEILNAPQLGNTVVYFQEFMGENAKTANRQRVMTLEWDEKTGTVRGRQHFFKGGPTYEREPKAASDVARLNKSDFNLISGCDLYFKWDAKNQRYQGSMAPRTCVYEHETDGMVYAEYDMLLWAEQWWYRDRSVKIRDNTERGAIDGFQYIRFTKSR
jgi:hypothetical protein